MDKSKHNQNEELNLTDKHHKNNDYRENIDNDEDDELIDIGMREVYHEMEKFAPTKDYLAYLPLKEPRTFCTPLIENEHSCIENNDDSRPPASDLAKIKTDIPPPASTMMDKEEIDIWLKCLDQVKIKLEYKQRQLVNLDLLKNYGLPALKQLQSST